MKSLAWSQLLQRERALLRRFVSQFGPALPAEDIVQDTFARVLAAKHDQVRSPRSYLFTTARNLALNELRRQRRSPIDARQELSALEPCDSRPSPEEIIIAAEQRGRLVAALSALPERHREALILFKVEGLSHKEIGARLGVSHRTVERYVADALARCHALLGAREE